MTIFIIADGKTRKEVARLDDQLKVVSGTEAAKKILREAPKKFSASFAEFDREIGDYVLRVVEVDKSDDLYVGELATFLSRDHRLTLQAVDEDADVTA